MKKKMTIGKKIEMVAKVCAAIGVIEMIASLIYWMSDGYYLYEALLWVPGVIVIISSWPLQGFGQMIDDIHEIKKNVTKDAYKVENDLPEL